MKREEVKKKARIRKLLGKGAQKKGEGTECKYIKEEHEYSYP